MPCYRKERMNYAFLLSWDSTPLYGVRGSLKPTWGCGSLEKLCCHNTATLDSFSGMALKPHIHRGGTCSEAQLGRVCLGILGRGMYQAQGTWEVEMRTLGDRTLSYFSRACRCEVGTRMPCQKSSQLRFAPLAGRPYQPKSTYLRWPRPRGPVWGSWRQFSGDKHSRCKPGQPAAIPQRHGLAQNGQGAAGSSSYLSGGLCCHSCSSRYKLQKTKNPITLQSVWCRKVRERCSLPSIAPWCLVPTGIPSS